LYDPFDDGQNRPVLSNMEQRNQKGYPLVHIETEGVGYNPSGALPYNYLGLPLDFACIDATFQWPPPVQSHILYNRKVPQKGGVASASSFADKIPSLPSSPIQWNMSLESSP